MMAMRAWSWLLPAAYCALATTSAPGDAPQEPRHYVGDVAMEEGCSHAYWGDGVLPSASPLGATCASDINTLTRAAPRLPCMGDTLTRATHLQGQPRHYVGDVAMEPAYVGDGVLPSEHAGGDAVLARRHVQVGETSFPNVWTSLHSAGQRTRRGRR